MIAVSADGPEIEDFKREEGVPHVIVPLTRRITPFQDLVSIFKLYKLIKNEQPDIVHSHTPKAGLIGMMAAFLAKTRVRMHTVAGLPLMEEQGLKRKVLVAVEKLTYKLATHVYPNSYNLKAYIEQNICKQSSKFKVIGNGSSNGIDTAFFDKSDLLEKEARAIRVKSDVKPGQKVAVFVGRITGDKGINELVKGLNKISGIKLFLVGPMEPELDPLEEQVEFEIKNNPDIVWFGFQKDVRPYFLASDFLVFPSYREGFPNVPLQAGALGLPSIVTDINGCNEIVKHKQNGLIIPVKDEQALISAMMQMINDSNLFDSMSKRSRAMVKERFDRGVIWEALEEEYKQLTSVNV